MTLPLKQQVTSREISEDLKSRGVPQKTLFYHGMFEGKYTIDYVENICQEDFVFCSAFTVSEIINMLGHTYGDYATWEITPNRMAEDLLREIDSGFIKVGDL